jgi:hypothetical protein
MQTCLLGRIAVIKGSESPVQYEGQVCEIVAVFPEAQLSLDITVRFLETNRLHSLKSCDICVQSASLSQYYQQNWGKQELEFWSKNMPKPRMNFGGLNPNPPE